MKKVIYVVVLLLGMNSLLCGCFTRDIPAPAEVTMNNQTLAESTLTNKKIVFNVQAATGVASAWQQQHAGIIFDDSGNYHFMGLHSYQLKRTGTYIYQASVTNASQAKLVLQGTNKLMSIQLQFNNMDSGTFSAEIIDNGNSIGTMSGIFSEQKNNHPYNVPLFSPMEDIYYK